MLTLPALALGAGVALQPAPAADAGTIAHVYATVVDEDGRHVDDLDATDFQVTAEGTPVVVTDATFVPAGGSPALGALSEVGSRADERAEAGREGTRLFAFLLDEYHVSAGRPLDEVRDAMARFVREHLGPQDLLVVFRPLDSLLNIRLTRDRDRAADLMLAFAGRRGIYEPRSSLEHDLLAADPVRIDRARAQIAQAALDALIAHLASLDAGQKAIVLVSEGAPGAPWEARVERSAQAARRAGIAVFPVIPDTHETTGDAAPRRHLHHLAEVTGGRAIHGSGRVEAGLRQMADMLGGYYALALRTNPRGDDGLRGLRVNVVRTGVTVRWSARHPAPDSSEDPDGAVETIATFVPRASPLIRPWFGVARAGVGLSQVNFVWEPAGPVPGRPASQRPPAHVALRVSSHDGSTVFEGRVAPVRPGRGDAAQAIFHAPPGRLRVEMRIEDDRGSYLDWDAREVEVRSPDAPVSVGTPRVFRTRTALDYREIAGDADAVPVASRTFSRAERLIVRVPVASASGPLEVTAALATPFGQIVRTRTAAAGPSPGLWQLDLPLAGLVAAEYRLTVTAAAGGATASEAVALRVVP